MSKKRIKINKRNNTRAATNNKLHKMKKREKTDNWRMIIREKNEKNFMNFGLKKKKFIWLSHFFLFLYNIIIFYYQTDQPKSWTQSFLWL